MLSTDQCKSIIFKLGIKLGISPGLITTLLMDDNDKSDMINGLLTIVELECHIGTWMASGTPNYREGFTDISKPAKIVIKVRQYAPKKPGQLYPYREPWQMHPKQLNNVPIVVE